MTHCSVQTEPQFSLAVASPTGVRLATRGTAVEHGHGGMGGGGGGDEPGSGRRRVGEARRRQCRRPRQEAPREQGTGGGRGECVRARLRR